MIPIGEFFNRIKNITNRDVVLRQVIIKNIIKHTDIEIKPEDISISKSGKLFLKKISPTFKSVLIIKKNGIIKSINEEQKTRIIQDIL